MLISPEAAALDAIFDSAAEEKPLRDKPWGRPLLIPGDRRGAHPLVENPKNRKPREDGRLPYTRASSLSNYVTDHSAVDVWEKRSIIKGLSEREDLAAEAAALPPIIGNTRDKSTLTRQEKLSDKLTNQRLDEIGNEAARYANRDYKASWGTAVHGFTDPGPHGDVPVRMQADVASWYAKTAGWEFLLTEAFVRNDLYQAAGTFDHLVRIPWMPELGAIIVDKKTGILHLDQFAIQGNVYATGELYDLEKDDGSIIHWPAEVNQEWAILAHIPLGLGRTDLYLVDLVEGRIDCQVACAVRERRQRDNHGRLFDPAEEARMHVAGLISNASSREELNAIALEYRPIWTEDLTALGQSVLGNLTAA